MMSLGDSRAAGRAVELDGREGQWMFEKGQSMRAARARKLGMSVGKLCDFSYSTPEEREYFQRAYQLNKNPQTIIRLARCYSEGKDKDPQRSARLVR